MIEVNVGIKVKIYPDKEQRTMFHKNFGCTRKAHNLVLAKYKGLYEKDNTLKPTYVFLNKLLKEFKDTIPYLTEVDSTSLQQAVKDLSTSFNNFFKNPAHFNHPVFHSKKKTRPVSDKPYPKTKKS